MYNFHWTFNWTFNICLTRIDLNSIFFSEFPGQYLGTVPVLDSRTPSRESSASNDDDMKLVIKI